MSAHERIEQIYETERNHIYTYLLYCGVPPQRAQELAQDSFLKLYLKMSRGDEVENPRAWLYQVAHNSALRHHQREPVFDQIDSNLRLAEPSMDPERALISRRQRLALVAAVRDLSPQQRNCLHLRARGLRYREIAAAIGISTSAVSEFLRRALVRLKEAIDA
jgi:RNA polymerase sigma-70 factor (ECF subfamily)